MYYYFLKTWDSTIFNLFLKMENIEKIKCGVIKSAVILLLKQ